MSITRRRSVILIAIAAFVVFDLVAAFIAYQWMAPARAERERAVAQSANAFRRPSV